MSNHDTHDHNHTAGRICAECGTSIEGMKSSAIYCSLACRARAGQRRRYHADLDKSRGYERAKSKRRTAERRAAKAEQASSGWSKLLKGVFAILTGKRSRSK